MIQAKQLSLAFNERDIFSSISFIANKGEHIALAGRNGAGKSTLLKAIVGSQPIDGGSVSISQSCTVAYMPQELVLKSSQSVLNEALLADPIIGELHKELISLELAGDIENPRYAQVHAELADLDYYQKVERMQSMLDGLGFSREAQHKPVDTFSVGWKMRIVLAQLLGQNADIYLFDEPTNHLDLPAKEWFSKFLQKSPAGFILISHDKHVVDTACTHTWEIERGKLSQYVGNYSSYLHQKEANKEHLENAALRQQKELNRMQQTAERFRAKASKAKMAQSILKKIEKVERIDVGHEHANITIPFPKLKRSGKIVLNVEELSQAFGVKQIFNNVSFEIERESKVAIIAPNGVGKTTLLQSIIGSLAPKSGEVHFGHNVSTAVFEQDQTRVLQPKNTVLEEAELAAHPEMRPLVRNYLGALLFSGSDVDKKVSMLSGGERNRLAMAKVLLQKANFLLLDEPTNHLDIFAKDVLKKALLDYPGTILFVSHDHDVVSAVATHIIHLTTSSCTLYPGNYESFLFHQQEESKPTKEKTVKVFKKKSSPEQFALQKKVGSLERSIQKREEEIIQLENKLGNFEYGTNEYSNILMIYEKHKSELLKLEAEWEEILGQLEQI